MGEGRARYAVRRALVAGGLGAVVISAVVFTRGSETPNAQPPPAPTGAHSTTTATTVPTLGPSAPAPLGLEPSTPECLAANTTALSAEGIRAENAQPGTTAWRTALTSATTRVNISLDRGSVQCGGTVAISLRGDTIPAVITVYRLGWYGGTGGRAVWSSAPIVARPAPPGRLAGHVRHGPRRSPRPGQPRRAAGQRRLTVLPLSRRSTRERAGRPRLRR
ncbi:MAG: hypothetical protein IPO89_00645 [Actinomycetales bacterium]|nr:hypothetical protein [Candidatus Lutibacillus vidarii]